MRPTRIEIAKYINEHSTKSASYKKSMNALAAYLVTERRSGDLERIMRDLSAIRFENGRIEAEIRTVHPLGTKAAARIKKLIKSRYPQAKTIVLTEVLDPGVIGGVSIKLPHEVLDMSVAGSMRNFRRQASERLAG